jgi:hypothetical protein
VADQVVLWADTAPDGLRLTVRETSDGLLHLYNVWDSGRGRGIESQAATSGMLREDTPSGWRYRCTDIAPEPTFDASTFRLEREGQVPLASIERPHSGRSSGRGGWVVVCGLSTSAR